MIELIDSPIDTDQVLRSVHSPLAGANVLFLGTTRQFTGDQETVQLDYDGYREMAVKQLQQLGDEVRARWPIVGCSIVHRLGQVEVGEASIAVAISSPHRHDCFAAAEWLMEQIKRQVPIWKREVGPDGEGAWVHPAQKPGPPAT